MYLLVLYESNESEQTSKQKNKSHKKQQHYVYAKPSIAVLIIVYTLHCIILYTYTSTTNKQKTYSFSIYFAKPVRACFMLVLIRSDCVRLIYMLYIAYIWYVYVKCGVSNRNRIYTTIFSFKMYMQADYYEITQKQTKTI